MCFHCYNMALLLYVTAAYGDFSLYWYVVESLTRYIHLIQNQNPGHDPSWANEIVKVKCRVIVSSSNESSVSNAIKDLTPFAWIWFRARHSSSRLWFFPLALCSLLFAGFSSRTILECIYIPLSLSSGSIRGLLLVNREWLLRTETMYVRSFELDLFRNHQLLLT